MQRPQICKQFLEAVYSEAEVSGYPVNSLSLGRKVYGSDEEATPGVS